MFRVCRTFRRMPPNHDSRLVAPQGFEPRYAAPEAAVLPLNEGATSTRTVDLAAASAQVTAEYQALKANPLIIRGKNCRVKPIHLSHDSVLSYSSRNTSRGRKPR